MIKVPNHRHEGRLLALGESVQVDDRRAAWMAGRGIGAIVADPAPPKADPAPAPEGKPKKPTSEDKPQ
jgi:hypothetical protein